MKEKKRKKRLIFIVILLLCLFTVITLRNSYALFEKNIEGNKINFVVGKLNYNFILDEDIEKGIYVKAKGYKVVHIELNSTNEIESKYAFVYKKIENVKVEYIESSDKLSTDLPEGTIAPNETKQIYLAIHNESDQAVRLEISVRGGLVNNEVEVENEFTKITNKASDTYKDSILNGTDPVLGDKMIPVTLDGDGTVHYASEYATWYNYQEKEWANAVILVNTPSETYQVGDIIAEKDIQSYFVWIPRYRYKLFNIGNYSSNYKLGNLTDTNKDSATSLRHFTGAEKLIDIVFETEDKVTQDKEGECKTPMTSAGTNSCAVDKYMTHPAFITLNVNGFWVGKFETGYNQNTDTNSPISSIDGWTTEKAQQNKTSEANIIIKPNVYSWRSINIGNIFHTCLNYKTNLKSHMMKNTEWGAVAYLSQSIYGIGSEVNINNNSSFLTGYSATMNTDQSSYPGIEGTDDSETQPYNTSTGYSASTTGNITGIYDMTGGAFEYMASFMDGRFEKNSNNVTSGLTSSDLTNYPTYFDKYLNTSSWSSFNNRILGDATGEMGPFYVYYDKDGTQRQHNSWFADRSGFVDAENPWIYRGGYLNFGALAGQFSIDRGTGDVSEKISFRFVLTG